MHFPDCTLKLGICTATPIGVVLLSSTNPLSLLINEISDWVQYYITQPRDIFLAVGGIVELNRKFVSIQLRVILLPRQYYLLNGRSSYIFDPFRIYSLIELILIEKIVDLQLLIVLIIPDSNRIPLLMVLQLIQHEQSFGQGCFVKISLRTAFRKLDYFSPASIKIVIFHFGQVQSIVSRDLLLNRRMEHTDKFVSIYLDSFEAIHVEPFQCFYIICIVLET